MYQKEKKVDFKQLCETQFAAWKTQVEATKASPSKSSTSEVLSQASTVKKRAESSAAGEDKIQVARLKKQTARSITFGS